MDTKFCYCCQRHHPQEEMRRFTTRHGERWRCVRSIEAAQRSRPERDAFGRTQSEINRESARRMAELRHQLHRLPSRHAP